jgi:hypothetical protein
VFYLVGDWVTRGEVTLTRSPVPYPLLDHNTLFEIDEAEIQSGHTSVIRKSPGFDFSEICQIF